MKKIAAILLAATLLALTACGGADASAAGRNESRSVDALPEEGELAPEVATLDLLPDILNQIVGVALPGHEAPDYRFEAASTGAEFYYAENVRLAYYDYHWQSLYVANLEELAPADRETAERNAEIFNDRLSRQMDEMAENSEIMDYASDDFENGFAYTLPYYDEIDAAAALTGQIVSVRIDRLTFSGGVHPSYSIDSMLFDLETGQFIHPTQIADDPMAFQDGAAELLIEKADGLGEEYTSGYWADYRNTIQAWDAGTAVLFDETGMTVIFSPYILGPYAMGPVELAVSCEELADLIGPGGMAKLGHTAGE